jgi:membrane-associated phospholipid phosphatase
VVQVVPDTHGAWLDAALETQSLGGAAGGVELAAGWVPQPAPDDVTLRLAALVSPAVEPVVPLPSLDRETFAIPGPQEPPWAASRFPRVSRAGYKVLEDYRNFYSCESLVCLGAAFGAGAIMANTGFDTTMQGAWMRGVEPTAVGTFFSDCKDIGEGRYVLPIFGAAALTGLVFEGHVAGDVVGEWGSRSLRMFVVGAPPLYLMQWVTGASRPAENEGSQWQFFADNNGVSGHAFVGAIPFLAAADMVESPLLKGTLYVCSTFVGFSRMTDNAHFPSQVFLGWYLAWASSRAVSATEMHFAGMEVRVVPLPTADLGGLAVEARW